MCPRNLNIEKKLFFVRWTFPTLIKARPHVAFCILSHMGNSMTSSNAFSSKLIDDNSPSPFNVLKLIWFDERFLTNL
jgi:hypothetical protein